MAMLAAPRVLCSSSSTNGRIGFAECVEFERGRSDGRVVAAVRVVFQRVRTDGRVADATLVQERIVTEKGVEVDGIAAFLARCSRHVIALNWIAWRPSNSRSKASVIAETAKSPLAIWGTAPCIVTPCRPAKFA